MVERFPSGMELLKYVNCGGMKCYQLVTCSCRRCILITNMPFPQGISMVCLLYNTEFLNNASFIALNPNKIHPFSQTRHINLLGFIGDVA